MKRTVLILLLLAVAGWWSGCAENQSPQPSKSHPESWAKATTSSREGHGQKVLTAGLATCVSCHGTDFKGGSTKISCYTCHDNYPHREGWTTLGHSQFHGTYLAKAAYATDACTPCHGEDLQNSEGKKNCASCHALYPHAEGWMQTGAAAFHGTWAKNANWDLTSCKACHGDQFQGGEGKQSCYTCHASFPHGSEWLNTASSAWHGAYLAGRGFNPNECKTCHGTNLEGGDGKQACTTCHADYPHETGFKYETSSARFHGVQLKANGYDLASCAKCHGTDYTGGIANASCFKCHSSYPHEAAWTDPAAATSHVAYLRGNGHELAPCRSCHGTDYLGGTSGKSCLLCHSGTGGPENCSLCHGSADGIQPPKDTQGNSAETAIGVGRHKFHVMDKKYTCALCHTVPAAYGTPGHVNDDTPGRAEILDLWQWNHATATCVTNCHANDLTKNYVWNH
jgi:hypothetical protein